MHVEPLSTTPVRDENDPLGLEDDGIDPPLPSAMIHVATHPVAYRPKTAEAKIDAEDAASGEWRKGTFVLKVGDILCDEQNLVPFTTLFRARLITFSSIAPPLATDQTLTLCPLRLIYSPLDPAFRSSKVEFGSSSSERRERRGKWESNDASNLLSVHRMIILYAASSVAAPSVLITTYPSFLSQPASVGHDSHGSFFFF